MVGRWLSLSPRHSGVNRSLQPFSDVTGGWYPPSEGHMSQCGPAFRVANPHVCGGPFLGELSGGNWMGRSRPSAASVPGASRLGCWAYAHAPDLVANSDSVPPRYGSGVPSVGALVMIVTWLILPVVICLSQRLSHACLSISNLYGETANGSLNQLSFI